MDCINEITILGLVCSAPIEVPVKENEPQTVKMKVVTNKRYFSHKYNEYISTSEKHSIKMWKKNATFALANIKIGDVVVVTGEIHYHIIKNDDQEEIGKKTEIIANKVIKTNNNSND